MIAPDSSIVVAALAPWHVAHAAARDALATDDRRLIAHVAIETTSALSRMPEGRRIAPALVIEGLERAFPEAWLALDAEGSRAALRAAVDAGVRGGALYDALIAMTAEAHGVRLVSADGRARRTYDAVGVDVTLVTS
ncbi:MAG: PIN domain-containing protein [Solirubrobacteraceae bacterium]